MWAISIVYPVWYITPRQIWQPSALHTSAENKTHFIDVLQLLLDHFGQQPLVPLLLALTM
jgi:hypothetical protein